MVKKESENMVKKESFDINEKMVLNRRTFVKTIASMIVLQKYSMSSILHPSNESLNLNVSHTYYVSPSGDDNNPGTQSQPFATIYKGIATAVDGDTVQVLPGTYYPTFDTRPIINKSINVIGSGRNNTIIDGSKITSEWTTDWQQGLVEIQNSNTYFGGFTVQNVLPNISGSNIGQGAAGIAIYSGLYGAGNPTSMIIVEKNYIYNTWSSGIQVIGNPIRNLIIRYNELNQISGGGDPTRSRIECLAIRFVDTFYIHNNYVHNGGHTPTGMVLYGSEGIILAEGTNNGKVYNNYVYDVHSVGIYVGYTNHEINDNIVERIYSFRSENTPGDGFDITIEEGTIPETTFSNINFHNNISYNNWSGFGVCNYHDPATPPGNLNDITIYSNIVYTDIPIKPAPEDIFVQNNGNNLSGITIKNNFANNIVIDAGTMPNGKTVSSVIILSGNQQNLADITNQFKLVYQSLKNDILYNAVERNRNSL